MEFNCVFGMHLMVLNIYMALFYLFCSFVWYIVAQGASIGSFSPVEVCRYNSPLFKGMSNCQRPVKTLFYTKMRNIGPWIKEKSHDIL